MFLLSFPVCGGATESQTGEHMRNLEKCHGRPELPRSWAQKKAARQPKGVLAVFICYYRSATDSDLSNLISLLSAVGNVLAAGIIIRVRNHAHFQPVVSSISIV